MGDIRYLGVARSWRGGSRSLPGRRSVLTAHEVLCAHSAGDAPSDETATAREFGPILGRRTAFSGRMRFSPRRCARAIQARWGDADTSDTVTDARRFGRFLTAHELLCSDFAVDAPSDGTATAREFGPILGRRTAFSRRRRFSPRKCARAMRARRGDAGMSDPVTAARRFGQFLTAHELLCSNFTVDAPSSKTAARRECGPIPGRRTAFSGRMRFSPRKCAHAKLARWIARRFGRPLTAHELLCADFASDAPSGEAPTAQGFGSIPGRRSAFSQHFCLPIAPRGRGHRAHKHRADQASPTNAEPSDFRSSTAMPPNYPIARSAPIAT